MENTNQPVNSDQTPSKNTSFQSAVSNWKGIWLLIIGILLVITLVGIGGYYLGMRKNISNTKLQQPSSRNSQVSNTITSTPINNTNFSGSLAFIRENNVWVNVNGVERQITKNAQFNRNSIKTYSSLYYTNPSISPDGAKVAFIQVLSPQDGSGFTSLYVVSVDNNRTIYRSQNDTVNLSHTPQWTSDGQKVLYEAHVQASVTDENNTKVISVNTATGDAEELTRYTVISGCGGGSTDPSFSLAGAEGARPVYPNNFRLSSNNMYLTHNTACTGYGVNVYNLQTKQERKLSENITQTIFSPDGTRVAGITRNKQILIIDVATGTQNKVLTTTEQPQVLYWSGDGQTIYYGTDMLVKKLTVADDVALKVFGGAPMDAAQNKAILWSINIDRNHNQKIKEFEAYDIKPLYVGNAKVILAMVDNPTKIFDAASKGITTNIASVAPTVNVVTLDLSNGSIYNISSKAARSSFQSKQQYFNNF